MAPKKLPKDPNKTQDLMAERMDQLAEFEDWQQKVLPQIRKLLREGKTPEDLYKAFAPMLAARQLSIALDPTVSKEKALAAIIDAMNRAGGKPTEKREVEHKFAKLPEQELDAVLLSELGQAEVLDLIDDSDDELPEA